MNGIPEVTTSDGARSANPSIGTKSHTKIGGRYNLKGLRFSRLAVVSFAGIFLAGRGNAKRRKWLCLCDCGKEVVASAADLKKGHTRSCGCLQKETRITSNMTHGLTKTSTYRTWRHMKERCQDKGNKDFAHYGARGITVCEKWGAFENFIVDMGERPAGLSIERKNNALGYFKENCIWATQKEQTRNMRRNRMVFYNGDLKCIADWAHCLGIGRATLSYRLKHYDPQTAFNMSKWSKKSFYKEAAL